MAKKKSQSTAQVTVDLSTGELQLPASVRFDDLRSMRKDPTISLLRKYAAAYVLASTWGVESIDPEQQAFVEEVFLPLRQQFMRTAVLGVSDFGWKPYEVVYGDMTFTFPSGETRKLQTIAEIKPLKNDNVIVRYVKDTGAFDGFTYTDQYSGTKYHIDAAHSILVNFDDEGIGEYGMGNLEVAKQPHDDWNDANEAAQRYDKKMAGSLLVIRYPTGKTKYRGVETDNAVIAEEFVKAIRSSGAITIPLDIENNISELAKLNEAWKIEYVEHSAQQASFVDRMKYVDALKARAFEVPEQAILEGEFGTKAEAGVHALAALLNMQLRSEMITELLNNGGTNNQQGIVNRLLQTNFGGEKNGAWLTAPPLTDHRMGLFTEIFQGLMADAGAGPEILDAIDVDQLVDVLDIPLKTTNEATATRPGDADGGVEASEDSLFTPAAPQQQRTATVTVGIG